MNDGSDPYESRPCSLKCLFDGEWAVKARGQIKIEQYKDSKLIYLNGEDGSVFCWSIDADFNLNRDPRDCKLNFTDKLTCERLAFAFENKTDLLNFWSHFQLARRLEYCQEGVILGHSSKPVGLQLQSRARQSSCIKGPR